MTRILLRYVPTLIALVVLFLTYASWNFGVPPTWTQFAERAETQVVASTVISRRIGNGTTRHIPTVTIQWPPGSGSTIDLGNVVPDFFSYGARAAAEVAAGYRPGTQVTVRLYEDQPYADRFAWFQILHASFLSVMSVVIAGVAWIFFKLFAPDRRRA